MKQDLDSKGAEVQSKAFIHYIELKDAHLFTAREERYRVYRYEGALNGLKNAMVLLDWKAD